MHHSYMVKLQSSIQQDIMGLSRCMDEYHISLMSDHWKFRNLKDHYIIDKSIFNEKPVTLLSYKAISCPQNVNWVMNTWLGINPYQVCIYHIIYYYLTLITNLHVQTSNTPGHLQTLSFQQNHISPPTPNNLYSTQNNLSTQHNHLTLQANTTNNKTYHLTQPPTTPSNKIHNP